MLDDIAIQLRSNGVVDSGRDEQRMGNIVTFGNESMYTMDIPSWI